MSKLSDDLASVAQRLNELESSVAGASPIQARIAVDQKALEDYAQGLSNREAQLVKDREAVAEREAKLEAAKADFKASVAAVPKK